MFSIRLYLLLFITFQTLFSYEPIFNKQERTWIATHPIVLFGSDYRWPPFDFVDENGEHTGLSSEYLELIGKKSGLKFKVETGVWSDILQKMKNKKFDGLSCAVETKERKEYLRFSRPYLSVPMVIITNNKNKEKLSIKDLKLKTIAINKGSYIHEWLRTKYPNIKLYLTTSNEESLEAVSLNKADAYIGNLAVATYIMNKYLLNNLKIVAKLNEFTTSVSIAIDKNNPILFSIIEKSLKSISSSEHQEIKARWKENFGSDDKVLVFSKKERTWLSNHKSIKYVIDNGWKPIEFLSKNNMHAGISSSYLKLISEKTGINFELIHTNNWPESMEKIKNKDVEMGSCMARTFDREEYLNFSLPYIALPQVFVTKDNVNYLSSIKELHHKKVVLVKGYYVTEIIKREHPLLEVIEVNSIKEALNYVTTGKAFSFIAALPIATYYIQKEGYSNLKISGMSSYESEFSIALNKDVGDIGIGVINKAIESISEKEKQEIFNQWLHVKYNKEIDYTILIQVVIVFLILIIASFFWNRKLSIEIQKRKLAQLELDTLNQKLLVATQKAQSANQAKSNFLSNMSHEIRTPMNAILGFAELLDESLEDKRLKSFVKTIRSSGQTLLYLINDILDLSKIESGKLELNVTKVNINLLLKETIDIFTFQAEKKGLKLYYELSKDIPSGLLLDPIRFKEILINLIGNALKFTDDGYIKIRIEQTAVYEHNSKIDIKVSVKDTGVGIEKSQHKSIFNAFEQSENQDIQKYGGTGLGLSISEKLVTLMNGTLSLESEITKGSCFIIELFNVDIASLSDIDEHQQEKKYEEYIFDKSTLLVVDDIKNNRQLIVEALRDTNVKVIEAINGLEAIQIAENRDVDLILMDIRMPVLDGYSATKQIKEFSNVPIVALTASIMQDELNKLKLERFDDYLRKPISKDELFSSMAKYLSYQLHELPKNIKVENKDITQETFNDKFCLELKENIFPLFKQAQLSNDFSAISDFAQRLLILADVHGLKEISAYANELISQIELFEIDSIMMLMESFEARIRSCI